MVDRFEGMILVTSKASSDFDLTGQSDTSAIIALVRLFSEFKDRLFMFYDQYLYLNIVWAIASLILVGVSFA